MYPRGWVAKVESGVEVNIAKGEVKVLKASIIRVDLEATLEAGSIWDREAKL